MYKIIYEVYTSHFEDMVIPVYKQGVFAVYKPLGTLDYIEIWKRVPSWCKSCVVKYEDCYLVYATPVDAHTYDDHAQWFLGQFDNIECALMVAVDV